MLPTLSLGLTSSCFIEKPSVFHYRIRSFCRHNTYLGSEVKQLAGVAITKHRSHAEWLVLVTLVAGKRLDSGDHYAVAAPTRYTNGAARVVIRVGCCAGTPATVSVAAGGQ